MTKHQLTRALRARAVIRTLAMGLWLPALLLTGLLCSYLLALHHPVPHHIEIAVAAPPTTTQQLQHQLDAAVPGGFTLWPVAAAAEARSAVVHHNAMAAYVPDRHHPQLYGALANGSALESLVRQTFTSVAAAAGTSLDFHELVPTVSGDPLGGSMLYVIMGCVLPAYFVVVAMQRAVGFNRRAHVATLVLFGAAAAVFCYFVAAYGMHAIPQHPLDMLYLFLLTQAVSLTAYGLVPFFGNFFPGVAVTLFVLLGIPTSSATVPVDMVPGFFRFLHPVLPPGNAVDAMRSIGYFDGRQLGRPTAVLCTWVAFGAMLIVLGYLMELRRLVREAAQGITEYVSAPPAEDPTVELPEPIALPPHRHRFGEQDPILTGRVIGATGESLPGASITVTDLHGRQLLHSRTDENGEYAATGFHNGFAVVVAGAPDHQPIAQHVLLNPAAPANLNFTLNWDRRSAQVSPGVGTL
jgi:hypothetical protein